MNGLVFDVVPPAAVPEPNRADIALFVGCVARRSSPLPRELKTSLLDTGRARRLPGLQDLSPRFSGMLGRILALVFGRNWESPAAPYLVMDNEPAAHALAARLSELERLEATGADVRPQLEDPQLRLPLQRALRRIYALEDLPVPIDTWDVFDALFDWDQREYSRTSGSVCTYLGAAVRSFFAQGGRKCYVVRTGEPWSMRAAPDTRLEGLRRMLPGFPRRVEASREERASWRGIAHLFGLPDVSFLCLPDLADACADAPRLITPEREEPAHAEGFVECSADEPPATVWDDVPPFDAPRCDRSGFENWHRAVRCTRDFLAGLAREVQLVAALPLAARDARDPLAELKENGWIATTWRDNPESNPLTLSSAFVQLTYPWLRTAGSARLPGGVESPDGVLAGVLARTVLQQGAFRTAAQQSVLGIEDTVPRLSNDQAFPSGKPIGDGESLADRLSVVARTPGGWRVLSDVTTSADETYRQACIPRLVASLLRTARATGETLVFEPSDEALWGRVERRFEDLLERYWHEGALAGARSEDAYSVRCDRSTMSQQDIDTGRLIAQISFTASFPVQRITVALACNEGGLAEVPPGFAATATGLA